jgi:hypothetical protein
MKKEQFRTMVKEIIKEVISEIESDIDEGQNAYPAGGMNDPKIDAKNKSKQDWAAKKASLDTLKNPNPSHNTPFFKGPSGPDEGKKHSQYPAGGVNDPKTDTKNQAKKDWVAKKASLDTLKNPNPSNKTPFFKGPDSSDDKE